MNIETLKTDLREFIQLSETITPEEWWPATQSVWSGSKCVCDNIDADEMRFIARSRNISPTMAKMLLVAVEGLESSHVYLPDGDDTAWDALQQLIKLWEETK